MMISKEGGGGAGRGRDREKECMWDIYREREMTGREGEKVIESDGEKSIHKRERLK